MEFNPVPLPETIIKAISSQKVAHAYIFVGPEESGTREGALFFARSLLCLRQKSGGCGECVSCQRTLKGNHPDLYHISSPEKTIKIEQIRDLQKFMSFRSYEGQRKICLLEGAHKLTLPAANSLLKLLEEPPGEALFILLTENLQSLLPTIISRCQVVWFRALSREEVVKFLEKNTSLSPKEISLLATLSGGYPARAMAFYQEGLPYYYEKFTILREMLTKGEPEEILLLAEELERERGRVPLLLELVTQWIRDILVWKLTGEEKLLFHSSDISRLGEGIALENLLSALKNLEEAQNQIKSNVNIRLALEVLLIKLGHLLRRKGNGNRCGSEV